jgi:CheY-like chemotaxis protein
MVLGGSIRTLTRRVAMVHLLVVDDDAAIRTMLREILTVLQNVPKQGHTMLGVWFLLLRRQLHTRRRLRASAGNSTGVSPVRRTPGQVR